MYMLTKCFDTVVIHECHCACKMYRFSMSKDSSEDVGGPPANQSKLREW